MQAHDVHTNNPNVWITYAGAVGIIFQNGGRGWPRKIRTLNNNDHNLVFWARETEHPQQTIVWTKTDGHQPGSGLCCLRSSVKFIFNRGHKGLVCILTVGFRLSLHCPSSHAIATASFPFLSKHLRMRLECGKFHVCFLAFAFGSVSHFWTTPRAWQDNH